MAETAEMAEDKLLGLKWRISISVVGHCIWLPAANIHNRITQLEETIT